jgi:hypothetical protein
VKTERFLTHNTIIAAALQPPLRAARRSEFGNSLLRGLRLNFKTLCRSTNAGVMSPTVFQEKGFRFLLFSKEEDRKHVHVTAGMVKQNFGWSRP